MSEADAEQELIAKLITADEQSLIELFRNSSDRKSLTKAALRAYQVMSLFPLSNVVLNSVLATASEEQLNNLSISIVRTGDLFLEFLLEYKPPHFSAWVHQRVVSLEIEFELVVELVSRGLCCEPSTNEYVLLIMEDLRSRSFSDVVVPKPTSNESFSDCLEQILQVERLGENSLATDAKESGRELSQENSLTKLRRAGVFERCNFLDASLDALSRELPVTQAVWYTRFHEALEPTLDERHLRLSAYASLLGSAASATVCFALNALKILARNKTLDPNLLISNLRLAIAFKKKSVVLDAISLIEVLLEEDSSPVIDLLCVAVEGFLHESPDVQNRIAKLIISYSSNDCVELREKLGEFEECLLPSVKAKLQAWLSVRSFSVAASNEAPYSQSQPSAISPLETAMHLVPILDLDQLISTCSYVLENSAQVDAIEQALDGIVRLSITPSSDLPRISKPLLKRASSLRASNAFSVSYLQKLFASFVSCWLTNDANLSVPATHPDSCELFMHCRLSLLLARLLQRLPAPLLSAPTHERGWIEPRVVHERWKIFDAIGQIPDDYEQSICLLRMPLSQMKSLLPEYLSLRGRFWDAVRFATRITDELVDDGSLLFHAAHSYRTPPELAVCFDLGTGQLFQHKSSLDSLRWLGTYFPSMRNQFVASSIRKFGNAIDRRESQDVALRVFLEIMSDASFQFDRQSYHALGTALIVANPELAFLARDVLIQLIFARRLCVESFGKEIAVFLYCERGMIKRMVRALTDVAAMSPTHSSAVRQVLERALQGGEVVRRDLYLVLELLHELLCAEKLSSIDPQTKAHLLRLTAGGKTAMLIKRLVNSDFRG